MKLQETTKIWKASEERKKKSRTLNNLFANNLKLSINKGIKLKNYILQNQNIIQIKFT